MFDLMPFNRREDNLFHYLDNLEKNFWGDLATNVSSFRTDVLDNGDKFVLEAELPGFQKEDIDIHVEGNTLTISAPVSYTHLAPGFFSKERLFTCPATTRPPTCTWPPARHWRRPGFSNMKFPISAFRARKAAII